MHTKHVILKITAIILLFLGAYAVRLSELGTDSIWHDEAWSIRAFHAPFETPDDNTPYLYYITGHLLQQVGFGDHPLALRYISLMIGLLTCALAYRVGKDWFGWSWGWLTGALVAMSPLFWAYSQEVRAYIAVPLVILGLILCVDRIMRYQRGQSVPLRWWLAILIIQVLGLYTHNLIAPVLVWVNIALGVVWLVRQDWRKMMIWAGIEISAIIAYIPWLLTQSPSGTTLNTVPTFSLSLVQDIWASYFLPVPQQLIDAQSTLIYPILTLLGVGLMGLAVAWALLSEHKIRAWMLISHVILVPTFTIILMIVASIDFHPRYMIGGVMGVILLCVASLYGVFDLRRMHSRLLFGVVLSIASTLLTLTIYQVRNYPQYRHDDFRGLAQYYATLPEDAVIFVPFNAERALQDYYAVADHLGITIQAQFLNVPLYSDEKTALDAINSLITNQPRHVEFLTWYQLPADVRGMYPCLLAGASQVIGETINFYGLATRAFTLTHPVSLQTLTPQSRFDTAQNQAIAYAPTPDGACIRTDWAFPEQHPEDAHVTVSLLNPFDQVIATVDQTIRADNNATVSNWENGQTGSAYALLSLPDGAPLRDYTLVMGVYDDANPSGFDVLDQAGNPAGKSARYSDAITAQGQPADRMESILFDDNTADDVIYTGLPLYVTAFVDADDQFLMLKGPDWQLKINEQTGLIWAEWVVPAGYHGSAELMAGEQVLKRYDVVDIPREFEAPAVDRKIGVSFEGVGELIGVEITDDLQAVTFVWRADGMTDVSYTVFAQYLDADGGVIAQSDRIPAQDTRPTVGWVAGEYILDVHTFPPVDREAIHQLIVGFYDPRTFERVLTTNQDTFAMIRP